MGKMEQTLKSEITRLARKEMRAAVARPPISAKCDSGINLRQGERIGS